MIKGIGIDIVENLRFENKSTNFLKRLFTDYEISSAPEKRKSEYYASRFASKEAFSKALGTGFSSIRPLDIEIREDEKGRPYVVKNEKILSLLPSNEVFLSISHEKSCSVAMVVIDGTL